MIDPAEQQALYSAILAVAFDGIIVSRDGMVVDVSQRLLELSGYTAEEVIGKPVAMFVPEEFQDVVRDRAERRAEGRFDSVVVVKDGRTVPVEAASTHVKLNGCDSRIIALRDVSERRQLEERLRHAQKLELVGRLAAGVAHDFNNLLTIIRGYSGLLQHSVSEPERDDVQAILDATESGAALTRELLAYGRQRVHQRIPVDVTTVVRGCERLFPAILGGDITCTTLLTTNIGTVSADPVDLQQLLLNLVINARDAMPEGGGLVIRTRRVDIADGETGNVGRAGPGAYAMLGISDTGSGIPEDIRARMFEPFFTTKEPTRGSGLGLALVQEVVERAGGFITVQSSVDHGTVISVYLPIRPAETDSDAR